MIVSPGHHEDKNKPNPLYAQWSSLSDPLEYPDPPVEVITPPERPEANLLQITDRMGSNEGGWFENPEGERFYVKFYENPDQGRVEYIANAIYEKLGVKAVHSELVNINGREAVASREVPNAFDTDVDEQIDSPDVQSGFVADAYLANWDVVGLVYDNIVANDDGFYRIDNGGSLIFRARGGDKDYSPHSIPELQTMRNPDYTSGDVFGDISEREIRKQAQDLLKKLTPDDIKKIVDESGLQGEPRERVLTGLLGRLEYLEKTYGESSPTERLLSNPAFRECIQNLIQKELERSVNGFIRPRGEVICDRDHIEGQKIDIISKSDKGTIEFQFKLRDESILSEFTLLEDGEETASGIKVERTTFYYDSTTDEEDEELCDAVTYKKGPATVVIADPYSFQTVRHGDPYVRSAMGLVRVEVPDDLDPEDATRLLADVLEDDFGIPNPLGEVSEDSERIYKQARYAWQHKIIGEMTPEQLAAAENLQRKEVFPGYSTYVEEGKHKEYFEKYGDDVRAVHDCHTCDRRVVQAILTHGLMSTSERFSRGFLLNGVSSTKDTETGGADSAFTRIIYPDARRNISGAAIVFKPEVFDRTDWYSYNCDKYGSTSEKNFQSRLSPDEIFSDVLNPRVHTNYNEQMFRTGIGPEYIECVEVDAEDRDALILNLKVAGFFKFNGKPIEDVIVARSEDPIEDTFFKRNQELIIENTNNTEGIISGELAYESPQQLFDYTVGLEDPYEEMLEMLAALKNTVGTEKLASDMGSYIKSQFGLYGLEAVKNGSRPEGYTEYDMDMYSSITFMLGLDMDTLYEEAVFEDKQKKAAEVRDVISGKRVAPSIAYVFDRAKYLDNFAIAETIVDAAVKNNQADGIMNEAVPFYMIDVGPSDLEYLKDGETPPGLTDTEAKVYINVAKILGLDLNELYRKAAVFANQFPDGDGFEDDEYEPIEEEDK